MKNERWLAPHYYLDFSCKADKCRNSCCNNWLIPISLEEYNKLITMDCSDELNRRIQTVFVVPEIVDKNCYRYISFNWLGQCPIQDKGLCYLHREKGERYLPKICRLYPRSLKRINGVNVACCSSSCERVIEMLYDSNCLSIEEIDIDAEAEIVYEVDEKSVERIKDFQTIIKDNTTTLSESIADICRIINHDEFEKDYNSNADPLNVSIEIINRFHNSNPTMDEIIENINSRYGNNPHLYKKDIELFETENKEWMSFFERIINNSMIYECFPFVDKETDQTRVYKGLCACYGMMRLVSAISCMDNYDKDKLVDAMSALFHLIDHTNFYYVISCLIDNTAIMLKM